MKATGNGEGRRSAGEGKGGIRGKVEGKGERRKVEGDCNGKGRRLR